LALVGLVRREGGLERSGGWDGMRVQWVIGCVGAGYGRHWEAGS